MTTKQLRARLTQLERSARSKDEKAGERSVPFDFPIDAAVIRAIADEEDFIEYVAFSRPDRLFGLTRVDPDTPEESQAHARIAELAKSISCPPSYGFNEFWKDENRSRDWKCKKNERPLINARMHAYKHSPEGRARLRLDYLLRTAFLDPAKLEELERLLKLYPEPWADPTWTNYVRWMIVERGTPADRKLRMEKHERRRREKEECRKIERKSTYERPAVRKVAKYFDLLRAVGITNLPPPPDRIGAR